ncbi:MAG: ABC transporter substrate-binding protein [Bacillota bacterium]|nr:ABC transporter substrate-binding protein [Bacillota bacterium]
MRIHKLVTSLVLSMALILSLVACSSEAPTGTTVGETITSDGQGQPTTGDPGRKKKDTLVLATWEDLATMDPQGTNRASNMMVQRNIFDKLVHELPDGTVEPRLATEWTFEDDLTVLFKLRDDVKFHDGTPFTAEDVLFTLSRGKQNPISASTFKYFDVEKSEVVDPHTFRLKLTAPYAAIFNTLSSGRGSIVSKKVVESVGDDAFARNPVGTGPYKFVSWTSGTEIKLVRNEEYWGDKAITQNVVFKIIPEAANRVIELETGGADVIYEVAGGDVKRVEDIDGAHVLMGPSNRYMVVTFSMQDEILANRDLRYALSYAIDKEALVKGIYRGTATTAHGYYPSNVFAFKDTGVLPYDLEEAKKLIAKAGYADGLTLKFNIENREVDARLAEAIQNMWEKIGVKVEIFQMDSATYQAQGNKFQIGMRAGNANEPSNILIIYDSAFGDKIQPNDKKLDEMLAKAKTLYNNEERAKAYTEIQEYLHEIRYSVPLAYTSVIYGLSDKVEGFTCDPLQQVDLYKVTVFE